MFREYLRIAPTFKDYTGVSLVSVLSSLVLVHEQAIKETWQVAGVLSVDFVVRLPTANNASGSGFRGAVLREFRLQGSLKL